MNRTFNVLLLAGCFVSVGAALVIAVRPARTSSVPTPQPTRVNLVAALGKESLPTPGYGSISRALQLKTQFSGSSEKIVQYTVQGGDSPSSIAKKYGLKPESILWANDRLNASAGSLRPGMQLNIPPVDGVVHTVHAGDTLESIAAAHEVKSEEILDFPGNDFDQTQPPVLKDGQKLMVPRGVSPILWSESQPLGAGQVASGDSYSSKVPNLGTGYFIWPVNTQYLTQEYWSGHLGIDIQTDYRQPVFAADSGTVTFAGWDKTGYGNFVVIDHGNGYKTTYGHNEAILVSVGQTVIQGQQISESGSTGNSTGNHLDFRIIYNGAFVNPLDYLP